VRLVIADTGPVNYLVLIGNIDLLPALFDKVILPSAVQAELTDADAPLSVRNWIADPPAWLHDHEAPSRQSDQASVEGLDEGEAAAIALAILLDADLLLMDDDGSSRQGTPCDWHARGSRSCRSARSG
jgi:predicted nucleic acid-binding protein